MSYAHPEYLVETDWLADNLHDPLLRVFDCTVLLQMQAKGPYIIESGAATYREGHIPGAGFLDLTSELANPDHEFRFMMPTADAFAAAMSRAGVGPDSRVILYGTNMSAWASRVWWLLRAFGFDNAAILNGGWKKWTAEGRSVSMEPADYPVASFEAHPRPELFADKDDVLAALGASDICLLDALPAQMYSGEMAPYGRPGHIAGSVNVSNQDLDDPETNTILPADALRAKFDSADVLDGRRVITYCGGGIAATYDAFALALLGYEDVSVYDASLSEWATDPELPMEVG
jgi:thiosulfate/3-mercaptopyruvate sulfurtransferase